MADDKATERGTERRTAADVMTAALRTCSPFSTVTEAALILRDEDCGAVPVMDEGKPVGILTDRDIALAVTRFPDLHGRPVSEVMTRDVVTVSTGERLEAIGARFAEAKVHRLLVIDDAGQLAGIIALSDLALHVPGEEIGRVVSVVDELPDAGGAAKRPGPASVKPGDTREPVRGEAGSWAGPDQGRSGTS